MDRFYLILIFNLGIIIYSSLMTNCSESDIRLGTAVNSTRQVEHNLTKRNKNILKIGFIIPYTFFCGMECSQAHPLAGGAYANAFKIAVEQINNNKSLLPDHYIDYVYNDSRLLELEAIQSVYQQLDRMNVTAFVGLGWFCHSISAIASAVNVPVISYVSILFRSIKCIVDLKPQSSPELAL